MIPSVPSLSSLKATKNQMGSKIAPLPWKKANASTTGGGRAGGEVKDPW